MSKEKMKEDGDNRGAGYGERKLDRKNQRKVKEVEKRRPCQKNREDEGRRC